MDCKKLMRLWGLNRADIAKLVNMKPDSVRIDARMSRIVHDFFALLYFVTEAATKNLNEEWKVRSWIVVPNIKLDWKSPKEMVLDGDIKALASKMYNEDSILR